VGSGARLANASGWCRRAEWRDPAGTGAGGVAQGDGRKDRATGRPCCQKSPLATCPRKTRTRAASAAAWESCRRTARSRDR
jgi:hypothetical protein